MSVFLVKGKAWWRYDFVLKGNRYTQDGFKTKAKAKSTTVKEVSKERVIINEIKFELEGIVAAVNQLEKQIKAMEKAKK